MDLWIYVDFGVTNSNTMCFQFILFSAELNTLYGTQVMFVSSVNVRLYTIDVYTLR